MDNSLPNSTNLLDYIDSSEKGKIEEYLQFLKCSSCNEVMIEPKSCQTCGYNICSKCKKCSHSLTQSRHIKALIENISFKCKFHTRGCKIISKYTDVKQHLLKCQYFEANASNSNIFNIKPNNSMMSLSKTQNPQLFNIDNIFQSSDKIFNVKINDYEGKVGVKCAKCESSFLNKNDFVTHFKNCPGHLKNFAEGKDELLKLFYKNYEAVQSKFSDFIFDKLNENKNLTLTNLNSFENSLRAKQEAYIKFENQMTKFCNEEFIKEDPEIMNLIELESKLLEEKRQCIENYNIKNEELKSTHEKYEYHIQEELENYRNTLIMLEVEEKWVKEDLESTLFPNDPEEKCTVCGNQEVSVMKYFCQNCQGKFCANNICSKKCKACAKYLCPNESKTCQLCNKIVYCEGCMKKCFYENCFNIFCPECYKKNEHQTRNSNVPCKFFTCEKDQNCVCLMTTLFCGKCEKRMCNTCLMNDKDHFPFLK